MLSIDDLRKLAEMQEKLLRISINDRDVNLEKYKDIVRQIDEYYFSNLLYDIKHISEHNQTLEEELQFLEQIISAFEQVLVEQVKFKNVCELYGDNGLELSDLSMIDKEYIDSRKNAISGYLINQKNISDAKKELDLLSGKLRDEEIKNNDLKKRLLQYEEVLRNNFVDAEGRYLNGMVLEYVSVLSEYKKLGYDFKELLVNSDKVKEMLSDVYDEMKDANDKLKTAELCYEKIPSVDSKSVLDEISLENTKVRYKLTMVKILDLLCSDTDNYDMFLKKRKDIFDLIKYRLEYIKKLGVSVSIDPFSRTKVFDQIKVVEVIPDNSKNIHKIRKSITELNSRLEEMISIRDSEKEEINNIKDIIIEREVVTDVSDDENISMNDIVSDNIGIDDVKEIDDVIDKDISLDKVDVLGNQVVSVRDISYKLNMDIISQKTGQVIRRVNEMVNKVPVTRIPISEDFVPELVIEQVEVKDDTILDGIELVEVIDDGIQGEIERDFDLDTNNKDIDNVVNDKVDDSRQIDFESNVLVGFSEDNVSDKEDDFSSMFSLPDDMDINNIFGDNVQSGADDVLEKKHDDIDTKIDVDRVDDGPVGILSIDEDLSNSDMFMSVDPFLDAPLFTDRTDEDDSQNLFFDNVSFTGNDNKNSGLSFVDLSLPELDSQEKVSDEMADAFWVVQNDDNSINNNDGILSFDEQVELLTNNDHKKR